MALIGDGFLVRGQLSLNPKSEGIPSLARGNNDVAPLHAFQAIAKIQTSELNRIVGVGVIQKPLQTCLGFGRWQPVSLSRSHFLCVSFHTLPNFFQKAGRLFFWLEGFKDRFGPV